MLHRLESNHNVYKLNNIYMNLLNEPNINLKQVNNNYFVKLKFVTKLTIL